MTEKANKDVLIAKQWHPPKGVFDIDQDCLDWVLDPLSNSDRDQFTSAIELSEKHSKTRFKSFDCSIMELADDIAYGIHDMEDAIAMGIVQEAQFRHYALPQIRDIDDEWLKKEADNLTQQLFSPHPYERKNAIGALVNLLIVSIRVDKTSDNTRFESPLLNYQARLSVEMEALLKVFKVFVFDHVISLPQVQSAEFRGQKMLQDLYAALYTEPERLMPRQVLDDSIANQVSTERAITDYLARLTDERAVQLHKDLFG